MKCISNRKWIGGGESLCRRGFRRRVQRSPPVSIKVRIADLEEKTAGPLDPKLEMKGFRAFLSMNKEKENKQ